MPTERALFGKNPSCSSRAIREKVPSPCCEKTQHRAPIISDLSQSRVVTDQCVLCMKGGESDFLSIGASFSEICAESGELFPFLSAPHAVKEHSMGPVLCFFTALCRVFAPNDTQQSSSFTQCRFPNTRSHNFTQ